jgi:hypothetical protein
MIVELEPNESGKFYDVKTATPCRDDQFKNQKPLWERAGTSTTSAEANPLLPGAKAVNNSIPNADADGGKKSRNE